MIVGVFLEQKLLHGGGFQQSLTNILILKQKETPKIKFIFFTTEKENVKFLKKYDIDSFFFNFTKIKKFLQLVSRYFLLHNVLTFVKYNYIENILRKKNIDLVYFLGPSKLSLYLESMNFIITVWDLSHRDMPEFPEVRRGYEFEKREIIYQASIKKAIAIIADSEIGKINIIKRYHADENRIYIAKFLPSYQIFEEHKNSYNVRELYRLNNNYIFYPAQFWAHKNHKYIIDALNILKNKYFINVDAVFCGSDKGNLKFIVEYIKKNNLNEQIHFLGFVPAEHYSELFKESLALVMPTYFGPTNIPPIEAFELEVPVLYSDLPEFKYDLKNMVIYLDLNEPSDLADKLYSLLNNKLEIMNNIKNAKVFTKNWTIDQYWHILENIFIDYEKKLRCWK